MCGCAGGGRREAGCCGALACLLLLLLGLLGLGGRCVLKSGILFHSQRQHGRIPRRSGHERRSFSDLIDAGGTHQVLAGRGCQLRDHHTENKGGSRSPHVDPTRSAERTTPHGTKKLTRPEVSGSTGRAVRMKIDSYTRGGRRQCSKGDKNAEFLGGGG